MERSYKQLREVPAKSEIPQRDKEMLDSMSKWTSIQHKRNELLGNHLGMSNRPSVQPAKAKMLMQPRS